MLVPRGRENLLEKAKVFNCTPRLRHEHQRRVRIYENSVPRSRVRNRSDEQAENGDDDRLDDSTVRQIRDEGDIPDHRELWFRAEDERHKATRLQPPLYRPKHSAKYWWRSAGEARKSLTKKLIRAEKVKA